MTNAFLATRKMKTRSKGAAGSGATQLLSSIEPISAAASLEGFEILTLTDLLLHEDIL
jgi:hypothetical protein